MKRFGDAVAMLFCDPERIFAGHETPAHRSLARDIGASVTDLERLQRLTPSALRMVQRPEGLAGLHEEDVLVIDIPDGRERFSKTEMSS